MTKGEQKNKVIDLGNTTGYQLVDLVGHLVTVTHFFLFFFFHFFPKNPVFEKLKLFSEHFCFSVAFCCYSP